MKKILTVEDDKIIGTALFENLKNEGFEVIRANDGETGLSTALREHPDLILLDILLPKMDGLSVLTKLRADSWGKTVPVIVLSNLSEPSDVAATIDTVNEYLVKVDWKIEDIVKRIKEKLKM